MREGEVKAIKVVITKSTDLPGDWEQPGEKGFFRPKVELRNVTSS